MRTACTGLKDADRPIPWGETTLPCKIRFILLENNDMKPRQPCRGMHPVCRHAAARMLAADEPIQPVPPVKQINLAWSSWQETVLLIRASRSPGFIRNSCHNLSMGGTDNIPTSIGDHWQQGPINARQCQLEHEPGAVLGRLRGGSAYPGGGPIANPGEMAFSHTLAVHVLESIPQYMREFARPSAPTGSTSTKSPPRSRNSRRPITLTSRFDKWLLGDKQALNDTELAGYQLFKNSGCTACQTDPR